MMWHLVFLLTFKPTMCHLMHCLLSYCLQCASKERILWLQILIALQRTGVTDFVSTHFSDLIRTFSYGKRYKEVLAVLDIMDKGNIIPEPFHYTLFLKACTALIDLEAGKRVHDHILKSGTKWDVFIQNALLHMYSKCGDFASVSSLYTRNMKWFVMMLGMREIGLQPDAVTYSTLLAACTSTGNLLRGKEIHQALLKNKIPPTIKLQTSLINMYGKCKDLDTAFELYQEMKQLGLKPDDVTFTCLLTACADTGDLSRGKQLHQDIVGSGIQLTLTLQNSLINMYCKCKDQDIAFKLYQEMKQLNPNEITMVSLLTTCGDVNDLNRGQLLHDDIIRHNVSRSIPLQTALINMYGKCKDLDTAFKLYQEMKILGLNPNDVTFTCLLTACADAGDLSHGKQLHQDIVNSGIQPTLTLQNSLINMYCKCNKLDTAFELYHEMKQLKLKPDVVTFICLSAACADASDLTRGRLLHQDVIQLNVSRSVSLQTALIKLYGKCKQLDTAFELYQEMKQLGLKPNDMTFICLSTACADAGDLSRGKRLHQDIVQHNVSPSVSLQTSLINMYGKCNELDAAFNLYKEMKQLGLKPNDVTFACLLTACGNVGDIDRGRLLHQDAMQLNSSRSISLQTALINMYGKCKDLDIAFKLYQELKQLGLKPNDVTFTCMLTACADAGDLSRGKELHQDIVNSGIQLTLTLQNSLINMYGKFHKLDTAFELYQEMKQLGLKPDDVTFICLLTACADVSDLSRGKQLHQDIVGSGIQPTLTLRNSLINMYGKCKHQDTAFKLYQEMKQLGLKPDDVTFICLLTACADVSNLSHGKQLHQDFGNSGIQPTLTLQNSLINMYCKCKDQDTAFELYQEMKQLKLNPNDVTFTCLLTACADAGDLSRGKQLHQDIVGSGIQLTLTLQNSLINMYGKCRDQDTAFELYQEMKQLGLKPDDVTFTCLLTACADAGDLSRGKLFYQELIESGVTISCFVKCAFAKLHANCSDIKAANQLLRELMYQDLQKDEILYSWLLDLCAELTNLHFGRIIHCHIINTGIKLTENLQSALVCLYAKCGFIENAHSIFSRLQSNFASLSVITWNSVIAASGHHGQGKTALKLFQDMVASGTVPNDISFLAILNACSHSNLHSEALHYFKLMAQYDIQPQIQHFNCLLDVLGRAGKFDEAEDLIKNMKSTDNVTWITLLGAARSHRNVKIAERAAHQALHLDPTNSSTYVLMGNTYAQGGRFGDASKVRTEMAKKKIKKIPGISCIEINGEVTCFVVGDRSHPQSKQIYAKLDELNEKLKKAGFRPDTTWVLQNIPEEDKERVLCYHRFVVQCYLICK